MNLSYLIIETISLIEFYLTLGSSDFDLRLDTIAKKSFRTQENPVKYFKVGVRERCEETKDRHIVFSRKLE